MTAEAVTAEAGSEAANPADPVAALAPLRTVIQAHGLTARKGLASIKIEKPGLKLELNGGK